MGTIFNIQKFCVSDGPGIRTAVFFKGCPLHCAWCHNPESQNKRLELSYAEDKCVGCSRCAQLCPRGCHTFPDGKHVFDRASCIACGSCTGYHCRALEKIGYEISAADVIADVMKDKVFYDNSGGGITLTGGEPLMQYDFTMELLTLSKENGLHTCIETCGFAPPDHLHQAAQLTDIFLYDYKLTDPDEHRHYTGVTNELILSNLKMLDSMGAKTVLRCPIIPTVNDTSAHFAGIAKTANSLHNILEINIEPYHPLGLGKSRNLGREYELASLGFPENEAVDSWIAAISEMTSVPVKKG